MFENRFIYTGSAAGTNARFTRIDPDRNLNHVIPVQAASHLPVTGGFSESRTSNFSFSVEKPRPMKLFSVASSFTRAVSDVPTDGKTHTTEATAVVECLTILDWLHVELVRASLKSVHGPKDSYATITPFDTDIKGLRLGDTLVTVEFDLTPFQQHGTKTSLAELYKKDADFRKTNFKRFNAKDAEDDKLPESKGVCIGSLVKNITIQGKVPSDVVVDGYTIKWPNVGRVILGEVLITDYYRRLTMLRVQLGSPVEGQSSSSDLVVNGVTMP